jgi:hypothetical protein
VCRDADQEEGAGQDDREPYVLVGGRAALLAVVKGCFGSII